MQFVFAFVKNKLQSGSKERRWGILLEFDIDILNETYQEMQQLNQAIQQNMKRVEFLIENSHGEWQSETERAFEQKLMETKSKCNQINDFLGEFARSLEEQVKQYENHEQELHSKLLLV